MTTHAIYLRVSSRSQDTRSQEADLKAWIKGLRLHRQDNDSCPLNDPETCAHPMTAGLECNCESDSVCWYQDEFTGKTMDRPGWNKLYNDIQLRKISNVVIWRLDRLGRTASGLTKLFDELTQLGIGLISIKDGLDLSTPAGRLMANVLASVAQFETEIRSERAKAGQEAARKRGIKWGGSKPGVRKKVTHDQVAAVKSLYESEVEIAKIARIVKLGRPTIYSILEESGLKETKTSVHSK